MITYDIPGNVFTLITETGFSGSQGACVDNLFHYFVF